jgi:hypothetical protein
MDAKPISSDALTRLRVAGALAYLQAVVGFAIVAVALISGAKVPHVAAPLAFAVASIGLGYAIGTRHQAWAAIVLAVMILIGPFSAGFRGATWRTIVGIFILLYCYARAYAAARAVARSQPPSQAKAA